MTDDKLIELTLKLKPLLRDDVLATQFCIQMVRLAHFWDDLYDGDRDLNPYDINRGMELAVLEIPTNPFYQQHFNELMPLMRHAILCWKDANELEKTGYRQDLVSAFGLRGGYASLFADVACIVGGMEWAQRVGPDLRRLCDERLEDYLGETCDGLHE